MRLEGWHLIIIIALAILLFGAPKLPGLARSVGQSLRIFKSEVRELKKDTDLQDGPDDDPVIPVAPVASRQDASAPSPHSEPSRT